MERFQQQRSMLEHQDAALISMSKVEPIAAFGEE
jgi:hypothetical protein